MFVCTAASGTFNQTTRRRRVVAHARVQSSAAAFFLANRARRFLKLRDELFAGETVGSLSDKAKTANGGK